MNMVKLEYSQRIDGPRKNYVVWGHYKDKSKIWDLLDVYGDKVVIVMGMGGPKTKNGVVSSIWHEYERSGKKLKVNYKSAHLVEVELVRE